MRVLVPITGELISSNSGNPDNPVRPIDFTELLPVELADFAWEAIRYDFEAGVAELEITFKPKRIATKWDGEGNPTESRPETEGEFQQRQGKSENALRTVLKDHTISELYEMAKQPGLKRPFKVNK